MSELIKGCYGIGAAEFEIERLQKISKEKSELIENLKAELQNTRTQSQCELYDELYKAALGLTHGVDWNNGNHAIKHGYREKLINAVNAIKSLPQRSKDNEYNRI